METIMTRGILEERYQYITGRRKTVAGTNAVNFNNTAIPTMYNGMQTPMNQQPQIPVQQEYFVGVNGEASARNYPIAPGSSVWLVDASNLKVYLKSRDFQGGAIILREYDLIERAPVEPVTENDIAGLKGMIESLKKELDSIRPIIEDLRS